jgi:tRNA(Ile)-lysidine synthase
VASAPHHRDLRAELADALERCNVRDVPLVVGVSGGADSTALLLGLCECRVAHGLTLTAAHLDHALRPDSAADAEWVQEVCDRLSVPLVRRRNDVAEEARSARTGIEETARASRRKFFLDAARDVGAKWVALAHTADDQAETILHRLVRGSGLRGLGGMAEASPLGDAVRLLRPLLGLRRGAIEAWLASRSQGWRVDVSNADPVFTRNRIRHELLPLLRREFNPQVDEVLLRFGEQSRDTAGLVESLAADQLAAALLEDQPGLVRLDLSRLSPLPRHLLREVASLLWRRRGWPLQGMTFEHWDRLAGVMSADAADSSISLPAGLQATKAGALLRIERA